MPTIFERIAAGEIPCHKVWEDEQHLAFLDISPRAPGHTLVIPKRASDYLFAMDGAEYAALWGAARTVADKLKTRLGCARVVVWVYGFEVPHVHVHLLPLNSLDDVPLPPVDESARAGLADMAKRLASGE
jgi:histidine triad (HIT) family protein